jgi:hypothetical protein
MHKYCIKKLPTGERVHKRDHFHDQRCASCGRDKEDDDQVFQCANRRSIRKKVLNQINLLGNMVNPKLCDILREGLMTYFNGESVSTVILRLRGQENMDKRYRLLIDEQVVIGWDYVLRGKFSKQWRIQQKAYTTRRKLKHRGQENMDKRYRLLIDEQVVIGWDYVLRGKFSKQWRIQQKAYTTRRKLKHPREYAKAQRNKKKKAAMDKNKSKKKNKTEAFHAFFQAIIPIIQEIWIDRCIDRNKPVLGGRIVAEYDSLSKKVAHMYTLQEMVLPEDELKIYDETIGSKL